MHKFRLLILGSTLIFTATGCVSYQTKPLVPKLVFSDVENTRHTAKQFETEAFTFVKASTLMSENSPELQEVRSAYDVLKSVADIKTPWANPSLELGPDLGSNLGAGATNKIQPFVGLGFTVALGGKLKKNDDLNAAIARKSFVEVQAKHRMLYLELRESYTKLFISFHKQDIQNELVASSKKMFETTKSLLKVGVASALDLGMIKLDWQKSKFELLELENELNEIYSNISIILGVDANNFRHIKSSFLPKIPSKEPSFDELKSILIQNHLELAKLRCDYDISENNLRLEVSKQYPDLKFGFSREREVGGKTTLMGLRIGIEIPIFDRNKQGIAFAEKEREHVRKQYIATAHEALSKLKQSYQDIKINLRKYKLLKGVILISAEGNLKTAKQSLENGGIDTLKYLDVLRTYQQTRRDIAIIESEIRISWINLEKVLGHPILKFPDEGDFNRSLYPEPTSNIKEKTHAK